MIEIARIRLPPPSILNLRLLNNDLFITKTMNVADAKVYLMFDWDNKMCNNGKRPPERYDILPLLVTHKFGLMV